MVLLLDELVLHVLSFAKDGATILRFGTTSRGWHAQTTSVANDVSLWSHICSRRGIKRQGVARPSARTYCSLRESWCKSRCVGCGGLYRYKVQMDGGTRYVYV